MGGTGWSARRRLVMARGRQGGRARTRLQGQEAHQPAVERVEITRHSRGHSTNAAVGCLLVITPGAASVVQVRSLWMMTVGTVVCLLFSDPMVAVLAEVGRQAGSTGHPTPSPTDLLDPPAPTAVPPRQDRTPLNPP